MYLSREKRGNSIRFRFRETVMTSKGRKERTLRDLGSWPTDLSIGSDEAGELFSDISRFISQQSKRSFSLEEIPERDLTKMLNELQEIEDDTSYSLGILFLKHLGEYFALPSLFAKMEKKTRREYNLYEYFMFIISRQILQPGSLLNYFDSQEEYARFFSTEHFKKQDFYDFLSFFYEHRLEIQRHLFEVNARLLGRQNVLVFYYDGTNFYGSSPLFLI